MNNTKVKFIGWTPELRKIRFIMLLHEQGKISLKYAKEVKDRLIDGEIIELDFKDSETAKLIFSQALKIGVICELI